MKEQLSIIEFMEQSHNLSQADASALDKTAFGADTSLLENIKGLSIQASERSKVIGMILNCLRDAGIEGLDGVEAQFDVL